MQKVAPIASHLKLKYPLTNRINEYLININFTIKYK